MIGNRVFLFVMLALILSSCTTYQVDAATYKWTDSKGEVNHAPMPPGGVAFSTLMPVLTISSTDSASSLSKDAQDTLLIQQYNCQEATYLLQALEQNREIGSDISKAKEDIQKYCQAS